MCVSAYIFFKATRMMGYNLAISLEIDNFRRNRYFELWKVIVYFFISKINYLQKCVVTFLCFCFFLLNFINIILEMNGTISFTSNFLKLAYGMFLISSMIDEHTVNNRESPRQVEFVLVLI